MLYYTLKEVNLGEIMEGTPEGYRPSIEEMKTRGQEATDARLAKQEAEKARKKTLKQKVGLVTAAGLAATAIGMGARGAASSKPELPDDRFTPERTASQFTENQNTTDLTPEQQAEKDRLDAEESLAERKMVEESLAPQEAALPAPDKTGEQTKGFR